MLNTISEQNNKRKKNNNGYIVVMIISLVVIAVLIGVIVHLMQSETSDIVDKKRPILITEETIEQIAKEIQTHEEPQEVPMSYQVTMNSVWEFESGDKASRNAYVANAKNNKTAVYFDVIRNDTQDIIYQSPVLPIGSELKTIELEQDLDAGNYECTLTYHLIDDEQNTLTTVNMWLMVVIEN